MGRYFGAATSMAHCSAPLQNQIQNQTRPPKGGRYKTCSVLMPAADRGLLLFFAFRWCPRR
ncbi:MAG: hypothetical protein WA744_04805, partial [Candidatus Acidiferrales bacterium]